MKKTVYLGADHAGFKLKEKLKQFLAGKGYRVVDVGAKKLVPTDDYPHYAYKVAKAVAKGKGLGILACGSAEGICIAANKVKGIRAVPVWTVESARQSREHNDANILCLSGGGMVKQVKNIGLSPKKAEKIAITWLTTQFSGATRHKRRIKEIKGIENGKAPKAH